MHSYVLGVGALLLVAALSFLTGYFAGYFNGVLGVRPEQR